MCYGIVTQRGGHIALDSEAGVGSTCMVYLPATFESPEDSPLSDEDGFLPSGGEIVMLVEDEPISGAPSRVLRQQGLCGVEAMRIARDINLLLTDVVMP